MPQRKTHDVYADNQKVGEVWEHYDVFTEEERAEKRQKEILDLYHAKTETYRITETAEYKTKEERAKRNFKIRKTIGVLAIIAALAIAVLTITTAVSAKGISDPFSAFVIPAIICGVGLGLTHSEAINVNHIKNRPSIDWSWCIGWLFGGGIGFLVIYFVAFMFISQFLL